MNEEALTVWDTANGKQLLRAIRSMKDEGELRQFLRDVMTESEIIDVSARLEAARLLREGVRYLDITEKTQLSSRTVARISDWMQNGCKGYAIALDRLSAQHTD